MMTLEQIKKVLEGKNLARVSRETGIGYNYLYSIATGRRENPSLKIYQKLAEWAEANQCGCKH